MIGRGTLQFFFLKGRDFTFTTEQNTSKARHYRNRKEKNKTLLLVFTKKPTYIHSRHHTGLTLSRLQLHLGAMTPLGFTILCIYICVCVCVGYNRRVQW